MILKLLNLTVTNVKIAAIFWNAHRFIIQAIYMLACNRMMLDINEFFPLYKKNI